MSRQPNILFFFPDQHRWDWLSCAGYGVPVYTPNVDALAARGTLFTQCRTNSPLCAPARASLATGLRANRNGVPANGFELDTAITTYFRLLRDCGYEVAAAGKTDLLKHGKPKGLTGWTAQLGDLGFTRAINQSGKWDAVNIGLPEPHDPYMNHLHQHGLAQMHGDDYYRRRDYSVDGAMASWATPLPREHYTDNYCGQSALQLLEEFPIEKPWHLWINFPGPHDPFDPPAELQRRYDGVDFSLPSAFEVENVEEHQQVRRNYAAMIEGVDDWVGRILRAVEARGELDNTIVVYASDHGEMLGDCGLWAKAYPHEPSVHVPLVIAGPGLPRGRRSTALIELFDLAPTFLDLAGCNVPSDWDARSFAPVLHGEAEPHRKVQTSSLGKWRMKTDGKWKLVEYADEPAQLYDLDDDPPEQHNLASKLPGRVQILADFES